MSDTFLCLLCRGVVSSRPSRYEDHLKLEHKVYFHMVWIVEKTKETIVKKSQENLPKIPQRTLNITKVPNIPQRTLKISKVSENKDLVFKKMKKETVFAETLLEESIDDNVETGAEDVSNEAAGDKMKVKNVNSFGCSVCPDISFENKPDALAHLKSHTQENNDLKKTINKPVSVNVKIEPIVQKPTKKMYKNVENEVHSTKTVKSEINESSLDMTYNNDESMNTTDDDSITENGVDEEMDGGNKTPELIVHRGLDKARTFSCSACPLTKFDQRDQAKKHIKTHIPLEDRRQYVCDECKERYATKSSLEKHVSACQGIQIRSCPSRKCDKTFDNKYDLKKHIREHKSIKLAKKANPLYCKLCSIALKTNKSFKRHQMSKHGESSEIKVKTDPDWPAKQSKCEY